MLRHWFTYKRAKDQRKTLSFFSPLCRNPFEFKWLGEGKGFPYQKRNKNIIGVKSQWSQWRDTSRFRAALSWSVAKGSYRLTQYWWGRFRPLPIAHWPFPANTKFHDVLVAFSEKRTKEDVDRLCSNGSSWDSSPCNKTLNGPSCISSTLGLQ